MILEIDGMKTQISYFLGGCYRGAMKFNKVNQPPISFFDFLPKDWKEVLIPQWDRLKTTSELYVIWNANELVCMGIVFQKYLPNLSREEQAAWTNFKDALYIGYLYTVPKYRGKGMATLWFESLKKEYPNSTFWLAIEQPTLMKFYSKLGFHRYESVHLPQHTQKEWILYCTLDSEGDHPSL